MKHTITQKNPNAKLIEWPEPGLYRSHEGEVVYVVRHLTEHPQLGDTVVIMTATGGEQLRSLAAFMGEVNIGAVGDMVLGGEWDAPEYVPAFQRIIGWTWPLIAVIDETERRSRRASQTAACLEPKLAPANYKQEPKK